MAPFHQLAEVLSRSDTWPYLVGIGTVAVKLFSNHVNNYSERYCIDRFSPEGIARLEARREQRLKLRRQLEIHMPLADSFEPRLFPKLYRKNGRLHAVPLGPNASGRILGELWRSQEVPSGPCSACGCPLGRSQSQRSESRSNT